MNPKSFSGAVPENSSQWESTYRLPVCGIVGTPSDLFGPITKHLLTVEDVESLYAIPRKTIYNLVHSAPIDRNPIPYLKRGRVLTFPSQALRQWLLRQGNAKMIAPNNQIDPSLGH